jgi:hypothetical protein
MIVLKLVMISRKTSFFVFGQSEVGIDVVRE